MKQRQEDTRYVEGLTPRFTREMALTLTQEEIRGFWRRRQRILRSNGYNYDKVLIDSDTKEVVARIDG